MQRTAKILLYIGIFTGLIAFFGYIYTVDSIKGVSGVYVDVLRNQAAINLFLWVGVALTEITVSYILNKILNGEITIQQTNSPKDNVTPTDKEKIPSPY